MTQEALKLALEALEEAWYHVGTFQPTEKAIDLYDEARTAIKEALAQPEQAPTWWLVEYHDWAREFVTERPEESIAVEKITALYTHPPQRTERPVDCERCNRLEEQAYDLVGKLRVANIKLSMQPQRTFVGLTDEEIDSYFEDHGWSPSEDYYPVIKAIEAKLKEKNT